MTLKNCPRFFRLILSALPISFALLMPQLPVVSAQRYPQPDFALEISLPSQAQPRSLGVRKSGRTITLILRAQLTITNPEAAAGFTAIDVWAEGEVDTILVRLSIIYNDVSNQEWWKDKKEKIVGTYRIRKGESLRADDLAEFGIEPFEMKVSRVKKEVFTPNEAPRIIDETGALEVVSIEKYLQDYSILLKNVSGKNIVAFNLWYGSGGQSVDGASFSRGKPVIAAGEVYELNCPRCLEVETEGMRIRAVVFEDGTYAGDDHVSLRFIVKDEGVKIQSPHVLKMIEEALAASDDEIEAAFVKLEADLWQIPEAISKDNATTLLRSKYGGVDLNGRRKLLIVDGRDLERLYEELKGGLYGARNHALSPLGDLKRQIKEEGFLSGEANKESRARTIREVMTRLKEDFERVIAGQR